MAKLPVWKDTYYNVPSSASPYTYSVKLKTGRVITINGVATDEVITVFNGKAWVRPGEEYIRINVNHIAQNYLYSDLPDLRELAQTSITYEQTGAYREFYICNEDGTTANTYNFLLNYSYEDLTLDRNLVLSEHINGHGTPNMIFLVTIFDNSSQKVRTTLSFNAGSGYDNTHCGDVALYYLNVHGGWDSFLIEGNVTKTDNYTRFDTTRAYDNTSLNFGKKTYNNSISTTYVLNTSWLTDEEAEKLSRNLFSSNMVYLHDLKEDKFYPVCIKDTLATYKTYKNQGHHRVSYQINVETSQTKNNVM